ncbi:MAG: ABC-F family ATP-binding cassette domain-containing protein [Rhodospirillales bacterium]
MLRIDNLTYRIGGRILFDRASVTISPSHRIGLVGRNGSGKTTLIRLITGELEPDGGTITIPRRWRVGVTRQEAPDGPETLLDTVLAADRELASLAAEVDTATDADHIAAIHERLLVREAHAQPARAARILKGLGFDDARQQMPCHTLSGGMRMRVVLAALLFTRPDLLLLDEPTNHLDLEASLWLEEFLRGYPGTLVIVSHDRDLLNRVTDEILHLERGNLTLYSGGYDRFEETRRLRLEQDDKERRRQEAERARISAFVERFRYKASKARQAQSRLKWLARLAPIADGRADGSIRFDFPDPEPMAPPLLTLDAVSVGYDSQPVLRNLDLRLDPDDRIALLGSNGNGKSTLMKLLAGRLAPLSGRIRGSDKLRIGYFAQHQADELDLQATPLIELGRRRRSEPPERLRAHLGRFGFGQERAETRVGTLSGGEKARLLFALMTADAPHILLLDEPTNHLDVDSRQALIEAINAFEGAVVLVSHDINVLELTADRLWLVAAGGVIPFEGDLSDYRQRIVAADPPDAKTRTAARSESENKRDRRAAVESRAALAPLRRELTATERTIEVLTATRDEIALALAEPELYSGDTKRMVALQARFRETEGDLAAAEERWLALQQALEDAVDTAP